MFFSQPKQVGKIETVIGPLTELEGNIQTKESVRIDGKVKGGVQAEMVILGANGWVGGDIKATKVTIGGKINGNVSATLQLDLLATGAIYGDIRTSRLTIAEGGHFEGNCQMIKPETQIIDINSAMAGEDGAGHKKGLKVIGDNTRR